MLSVLFIILRVWGGLSIVLSFMFLISLFTNTEKVGGILLSAIAGVLSGLAILAISEVIRVLFVIEENTRKTADTMQTILSTLPVQGKSDHTRIS